MTTSHMRSLGEQNDLPAAAAGHSNPTSTASSLVRFSSFRDVLPLQFDIDSSDSADAMLFHFTDKEIGIRLPDRSELADRTQVVAGLADTIARFPQVGKSFLGFRLLGELGSGAFGRVYLAQQGDLANRLVALKITTDVTCESEALAQLQHTNIVPIHSVHHSGPFHAICMPYFGATTLTDLLKELRKREQLPTTAKELVASATFRKQSTVRGFPSETSGVEDSTLAEEDSGITKLPVKPPSHTIVDMLAGRTYIEGVVWVTACLADGLAHAHDRGILHLDLKPANILFTDEGQPMLLDFNLSQDIKRTKGVPAFVGGTLPYMAPEQLRAYLGERSEIGPAADIFSLGVIIFELLGGQHPYTMPKERSPDLIREMLAERLRLTPDIRKNNPAVSPALASIVQHCLEVDPEKRYRSARELHEDLDRFMHNLPLRFADDPSLGEKVRRWKRRHPKLMSAMAAVTVSLLVFGPAIGIRNHQLTKHKVASQFAAFQKESRQTQCQLASSIATREQLSESVAASQKVLGHFVTGPGATLAFAGAGRSLESEQREQLREAVAGSSLMMAQAERLLAEGHTDQKKKHEHFQEALRHNDQMISLFAEPPRAALLQRSRLLQGVGEKEAAAKLDRQAENVSMQSAADFTLEGSMLLGEGKMAEAAAVLEQAVSRSPQGLLALYLKGLAHKQLSQFAKAEACFSSCVVLAPDATAPHLMRGITYARHGNLPEAAEDLDEAIRRESHNANLYLERANVREKMGDYKGAIADLNRALKIGAPFVTTCTQRAAIRQKAGDTLGARRDRQQASAGQPTTSIDWLTVGWAKHKTAPKEALQNIDHSLAINPVSKAALNARAYLLATSLKRPKDALEALDRLLKFFPDDVSSIRRRGLLYARGGQRELAHADAARALQFEDNPASLYHVASIYAQTSKLVPEDADRAFALLEQVLKKGYGNEKFSSDEDFQPLKADKRFQHLATTTRKGNLAAR